MLPDIWKTMSRLLLCWFNDFDDINAVMQLNPAYRVLRQALPEAEITLLTFYQGKCEFFVLSDELEDSTLNLKFKIQNPSDNRFRSIEVGGFLLEALRDRSFDAAIIFTALSQSPYSLAYLCYLAGIPIRVGQSNEFGGGVLSQWIKPPLEAVSPTEYYLHLLRSTGFRVAEQVSVECTKSAIQEAMV